MSTQITIDLPSQSVAELGLGGEDLAREIRIGAAIYFYGRSELSQEQAAILAGMSRIDFLRACGDAGVDVFQANTLDRMDCALAG